MSGLISWLQASCTSCVTSSVMPTVPDICVTKPVGVTPVAIGFIRCSVVLTAPITVAQIQALVASGDARFKRVNNCAIPDTNVEAYTIDAWIPDISSGYDKTITFEDPYYDLVNFTDFDFWDFFLDSGNNLSFYPVFVYADDMTISYRSTSGYALKSMGLALDGSARTNKMDRKFELTVKWSGVQKLERPVIIAGISALYGH